MDHPIFVLTIRDLVGLAIPVIFILVVLICVIIQAIKEALCKHEHTYETSACDSICVNCGKNLGFIGTWRDSHQEGSHE